MCCRPSVLASAGLAAQARKMKACLYLLVTSCTYQFQHCVSDHKEFLCQLVCVLCSNHIFVWRHMKLFEDINGLHPFVFLKSRLLLFCLLCVIVGVNRLQRRSSIAVSQKMRTTPSAENISLTDMFLSEHRTDLPAFQSLYHRCTENL